MDNICYLYVKNQRRQGLKQLLRIEFKRAFHSVSFCISLGIGLVICLVHFVRGSVPNAINIINSYSPVRISSPYSVFESWICQSSSGMVYMNIYLIIIPIISVMAYACSYNSDRKSGYVKNLYTRGKKINYLVAKYFASCISGGVAVVLPLLLNLMATAAILPSIRPEPTLGPFIKGPGLWSDVFYTRPYEFILRYFVMIFIFQFVYVSVALAISEFVNNSFLIMLFPFLLNYFAHTVLTFLGQGRRSYSPIVFLDMKAMSGVYIGQIVAEWVIIILITSLVYFIKGAKDETL